MDNWTGSWGNNNDLAALLMAGSDRVNESPVVYVCGQVSYWVIYRGFLVRMAERG